MIFIDVSFFVQFVGALFCPVAVFYTKLVVTKLVRLVTTTKASNMTPKVDDLLKC